MFDLEEISLIHSLISYVKVQIITNYKIYVCSTVEFVFRSN